MNDSIVVCLMRCGVAIKAAFGQRVWELRTEKGLSQEDLALACDLDRTYIGGIERGKHG